jgi:hypothetical protein
MRTQIETTIRPDELTDADIEYISELIDGALGSRGFYGQLSSFSFSIQVLCFLDEDESGEDE